MESRRTISRELALLTLPQLSKTINKTDDTDIAEIIEMSVNALMKEAESHLNSSVKKLVSMRDYIINYEINHLDNTERPLEDPVIPVAMPMTSDMTGELNALLSAAENLGAALDIIEISSVSYREEVKDYTIKLIKTFVENKELTDSEIKKHAKGWDIKRLLKVDRDILRISITELLFFEDIPAKVSINEAVELAKKYGTEESSNFINGILRQVFEKNKSVTLTKL